MQTDRYTKVILTVIAIGLMVNIIAPFLKPTPAIAQSGAKKWTSIEFVGIFDYDKQTYLFKQGYEPFACDGHGSIYLRK